MESYVEKAKGKTIADIKDDREFQKDLIRFLSSSRKNYSLKELKEKDVDWMVDEYVEHMRSQDTNEATALQDLYFARDKNAREQDRLAFGRLMMAWDSVERAGTGKGVGDYLEAIATSPSTIAGVFTGGFSKLGALGATKASAIGARAAVSRVLSKEFAKEAAKGFATTAAVEGALGYGQIEAQEAAREETVEDYEGMSNTQKAISVGLNSAFGGAIGGIARGIDVKSADKAYEVLEKQSASIAKSKLAAAKKATNKLKTVQKTKAGKEKVGRVVDRITELNNVLAKRRIKLDPLNKEQVAIGEELKDTLLRQGPDKKLSSGLSRHTLQAITAATYDIIDKFKIPENERISSVIASKIRDGSIKTKEIDEIIDEYTLSREEFSYIFLSDLSEAGRTLGLAGRISQEAQKDILTNIERIAEQGLVTEGDSVARQISDTIGVKKGAYGTLIDTLKGLDSVRIAFMTSQLGTTAANTMFSTARIGIDVVDEVFRQTLRVGKAAVKGEKVPISSYNTVTSALRGMSISRDESIILREMFKRDLPEEYQKIFYDINRVEISSESSSLAGKIGSTVNILNSAVDTRFKQAAFYASIDRQLIEKGSSASEFLKRNNSLLDLPEDVRSKAVYEALDFVFQKGYAKPKQIKSVSDAGMLTARGVLKLHKEAPFVVSGVLGMPFPRYVANHIEFINDYTPIALITGGAKNFDDSIYSNKLKDVNERWARQLTGVTLFTGAVYARGSQVEFDNDGNAVGMKTNFSDMQFGEEGKLAKLGRVSGALAAHQLLADLWVRNYYDLPMPEYTPLQKNVLEVAGGLGNMGFDKGLTTDIRRSFESGSITEGLKSRFTDIGATFSYPATIFRDLGGQIDPELGYTPYTRSLLLSDNNMLNAMLTDTESFNRLVRFFPEVEFVQYTQSFNGKTSTPIYDPFSGRPVTAVNPMTKQLLGIETRAAPTELQKEIANLGLQEYKLYGRNTVENPTLDWLVRYGLSKTLPKSFEEHISKPLVRYNNVVSYGQLSDEKKRLELKAFLRENISQTKSLVTQYFDELERKNPRAAASYIRNSYEIMKKQNLPEDFSRSAFDLSRGKFDNADDFIADAETIEDELFRRQELIRMVKTYDVYK